MTRKQTVVTSVRMTPHLKGRIQSYCAANDLKEADAIRDLLEKGLACESLSVFATPWVPHPRRDRGGVQPPSR